MCYFFQCQFISLLCTVWSNPTNAIKLQARNVILICEGTAYQLTSEDGKTTEKTEIETLRSSQEETDSRVVLYCMYVPVHPHQKSRQPCLFHAVALGADTERSGHTV